MNREEDIICDFLTGDRIWPPSIGSDHGHLFFKALVEVLGRLPDNAYEVISEMVWFIFEDPRFMAQNVPFTQNYPPSPGGVKVRFHTIVIYHQALTLPRNALIGLLAHELAHSFVEPPDAKRDEQAADALVIQWGFGKELKALEVERQKFGRKLSSATD